MAKPDHIPRPGSSAWKRAQEQAQPAPVLPVQPPEPVSPPVDSPDDASALPEPLGDEDDEDEDDEDDDDLP